MTSSIISITGIEILAGSGRMTMFGFMPRSTVGPLQW